MSWLPPCGFDTRPEPVGEVWDRLIEASEKAHAPVRDVAVVARSEEVMTPAATLVSAAVDPHELDAVAASLGASPLVSHAPWSSSAEA